MRRLLKSGRHKLWIRFRRLLRPILERNSILSADTTRPLSNSAALWNSTLTSSAHTTGFRIRFLKNDCTTMPSRSWKRPSHSKKNESTSGKQLTFTRAQGVEARREPRLQNRYNFQRVNK